MRNDLRISTWFYNGGLSTATSYINAYTDSSGNENTQELHKTIEQDKLWIEQLPSQIVLDDWRLVHAGYDPNVDLDCQTDSELLHVRKPFHRATEPMIYIEPYFLAIQLPSHCQGWAKKTGAVYGIRL